VARTVDYNLISVRLQMGIVSLRRQERRTLYYNSQ